MFIRRNFMAAILVPLLMLVTPAMAQEANPPAHRLAGKIVSIDGAKVTITTAAGTPSTFLLSGDTVITRDQPSSLQAIKAGDFVASAATRGADGKLHSTEVRIFPEAMRGLGEGQRPMSEASKIMTNAAVSEVVAAPQGQVLKVKFKGGESELVVDKSVPIIAVVVTDASSLKPGMSVFVMAVAASDGTLTARRVLGR